MPFLGKDWRSPGWNWKKTEKGWKRIVFYGHELADNNSREIDLKELCNENKDNLFVGDVCELTTKKRKKDYNNNTNSQFIFRDKWISVQRGSTKELHGYCTIGEALNRLDFSSAVQDLTRFNYVAKLFQLIAQSQLPHLSGAAQKNYFNILEKIVRKVLDDHYNPRLIKELLQDLNSALYRLTVDVGKSLLVGNVNIWLCRMETILNWQHQLNNLQFPEHVSSAVTLSDLPLQIQSKIIHKLSDAYDIINLGKATATMHMLSEDRKLWKQLCHFHFSEKQLSNNVVLTESNNVDWKVMYFNLHKYYPKREQYGDTLHFCKHCKVLFWKDRHLALLFKDGGHPCTANDPDNCLMAVSPQHFIDLFKF
ncbi:F-box only protein 25 [Diretmus argenteus]